MVAAKHVAHRPQQYHTGCGDAPEAYRPNLPVSARSQPCGSSPARNPLVSLPGRSPAFGTLQNSVESTHPPPRALKVLAIAPLIDAISLAYFQYISEPKKEAERYAAGAVPSLWPTFVGIESN